MRLFQKYGLDFYNPDGATDSRIEFEDFDQSLVKDEVTISIWFKPKYVPYGENQYLVSLVNRFLLGCMDIKDHKVFRVLWSGLSNPPYYYDGGGDYAYDWQEDVWQHWVATFRDGYYKGFVNGVQLFGRMDGSRGFKYYDGVLSIDSLAGYGCINGTIGEVRIYDRALSDTEVQYLYNGGHIEDGLVFWLYPDDESVTLDSDGQTVLSVKDKVDGYVGTAYNGVKLVKGKDVELLRGKALLVRKV